MSDNSFDKRYYMVYPDHDHPDRGPGTPPHWVVRRPGHKAYRILETQKDAIQEAKLAAQSGQHIGIVIYDSYGERREVWVNRQGLTEALFEMSHRYTGPILPRE